jgi:hypothetical protein
LLAFTICVIFACAICMTPQCATAAASEGAAMTPHSWNIHKISIEDLGNLFETWCLLQFFSCYFYWLIFHVERPARP